MTDEDQKRYAERQRELMDALQDEKVALRELVDKLTRRLDETENSRPRAGSQTRSPAEDQNHQPVRNNNNPIPRDERPPRTPSYMNRDPRNGGGEFREDEQMPRPTPKGNSQATGIREYEPRRSTSRPDWNPGPYKNPRNERDVLSPKPRKSPFDVDRATGKTEWELSEPYLKAHEKAARSQRDRSDYSYDRGNERGRNTSNVDRRQSREPKTGDQFCGLCEVYDDKQKYNREPVRDRSPERFNEHREVTEPVTYYVEGKILGRAERPAYIRDLFKPNHLG